MLSNSGLDTKKIKAIRTGVEAGIGRTWQVADYTANLVANQEVTSIEKVEKMLGGEAGEIVDEVVSFYKNRMPNLFQKVKSNIAGDISANSVRYNKAIQNNPDGFEDNIFSSWVEKCYNGSRTNDSCVTNNYAPSPTRGSATNDAQAIAAYRAWLISQYPAYSDAIMKLTDEEIAYIMQKCKQDKSCIELTTNIKPRTDTTGISSIDAYHAWLLQQFPIGSKELEICNALTNDELAKLQAECGQDVDCIKNTLTGRKGGSGYSTSNGPSVVVVKRRREAWR